MAAGLFRKLCPLLVPVNSLKSSIDASKRIMSEVAHENVGKQIRSHGGDEPG